MTSIAFSKTVLFADMVMSDVSLQFREEKIQRHWTEQLWFAVIPIIAIALALVIYQLARRRELPTNSRRGLLIDLCRVHRLNRCATQLVVRMADATENAQPATLFLGPEFFEAAVQKAQADGAINGEDDSTLKEMRHRLFAV